MNCNLPFDVIVDGEKHNIRNRCDYRVILDIIEILNDADLTNVEKIQTSIFVFYEEPDKIENVVVAFEELLKVLNLGEDNDGNNLEKPIMDWQHDFPQIAPAVSRVLGYSVRNPENYTHWYDFCGAYMEIGGDCTFANIVSLRSKMRKGKKLDECELEFYRKNKKIIDLPQHLTQDEKEWLEED